MTNEEKELKDQKFKLRKECMNEQTYISFSLQESVINAVNSKKYTLEQIAWQKKVESLSGIVDLGARRYLAEQSIRDNDSLNEVWLAYKKNGGIAKSPNLVKQTLTDPCIF